jgi:tetratricopeptide (TPR) repeat protein
MAVGIVHVSLTARGRDEVELRYWTSNPNDFRSRTLDLREIGDLVDRAEAEYYGGVTREGASEADRPQKDLQPKWLLDLQPADIGRRLFDWLDGSDRWLVQTFRDVGEPVIALAIEARDRLGHLPWELLHDGSSFLVHGANPAVLPVRWKRTKARAHATQNRPLQVLFMATSPERVQELAYEDEEARILKATEKYPLALTVEETGNLDELGDLVEGYPDGHFDVLHLTGHADHRQDGPRFLTESATGEARWVSAQEIAQALPRRPPLVFLSGCRTGQSPGQGAVPSLAEGLLDQGFVAVIGWGRPVLDDNAIVAAAALYDRLATGFGAVEAMLHAHLKMNEAKAPHWHLLRLFVAGDLPPAPVTPPMTRGRAKPIPVTHDRRFLAKSQNVGGQVVGRFDFVGRRRPLQRFLRQLRSNEHPVGAVIFGLGGVGKSSLARRLCDRLAGTHDLVVHVGVLDEPGLLRSFRQLADTNAESLKALQAADDPLDLRLRDFFNLRAQAGQRTVLLVLDDFEQNLSVRQDGEPVITPEAQAVMEALAWAVEESGAARCLITSRYQLTTSQGARFYQEELSRLQGPEAAKKYRSLGAYREADKELKEHVARVADGNPRLMERLDEVLKQKSLDHAALLAKLEGVEARFREEVLEGELVAKLPEESRKLVAALLVYSLPVPFLAVTALVPDRPESEVTSLLQPAVTLGLLEQEPRAGGDVYRVPRLLEPLLAADQPIEADTLVNVAASTLFRLWWQGDRGATETEALEIARLGRLARRSDIVISIITRVGPLWEITYRYREALALYQEAITAVGRDYRLLLGLGLCELKLGEGDRAHALLEEATSTCPEDDGDTRQSLLLHLARSLILRGETDKGLKLLHAERLPLLERLGRERDRAITFGEIADVLQGRGEHEEALRIRRQECLPVYERLGALREKAVTMGRIADALQERGEYEEALRIRRQECLPVYERLGAVREKAVTMGKIAEVLQVRGEHEEALRIHLQECLPVYERLGAVREKALTMGRIADVMLDRGEHEEALRICRQECLPIFERLGAVGEKAQTMGRIADALQERGEYEEALRIRRQECLPVYERLGAVREKAMTMGRIADALWSRGGHEEALRIYRQECLPIFERVGDVQSQAVTMGKIADVLRGRGDYEASQRILSAEVLPVLTRLGDLQLIAQAQLRLGLLESRSGRQEEAVYLLGKALQNARRAGDRATVEFLEGQLGNREESAG